MSYIGNQITAVPFQIDLFNGNASQTVFGPLVRAPATASIAVFISGVYKTPGIDYTVDGDYITFSSAPASGTNNIVIHHIGNGFMATQVPGDGTVSGNKLQNNIISGNNIVENAIRGNNIVAGQITGNLIGTGAISANHYAGGGVTSNVLASNLEISVARVAETINITTTGVSGNYNIECVNSTVYLFTANSTGNISLNLVANTGDDFATNGLDSLLKVGQSVSITCFLKQGSTRYRANVFIDGERANSIFWVGNSQPQYQENQPQSLDVYSVSAIKIGANSWTVVASNTAAGYANGQGMGATNGTVY
jgi:hypothetical protein